MKLSQQCQARFEMCWKRPKLSNAKEKAGYYLHRKNKLETATKEKYSMLIPQKVAMRKIKICFCCSETLLLAHQTQYHKLISFLSESFVANPIVIGHPLCLFHKFLEQIFGKSPRLCDTFPGEEKTGVLMSESG